jgi:beta-glucosidase
MTESIRFPEKFLWGTAACAHQVEGGNVASDWWAFEQVPGRIRNGERSGAACDHWTRYEEDFDLCRAGNHNAHRLSFEWAKIEPREGEIDDEALAHYHRVLDAMEARGLVPFVTVHHFTLPMWFAMRGGFAERANLRFFERHCGRLADEFGARVRFWNTINEPAVYATMGYLAGIFPPGTTDLRAYARVMRHILMAHAIAYHTLKAAHPEARVGLVKNLPVFNPADPNSLLDRRAAAFQDRAFNGFMLEALRTGRLARPLGDGKVFPGLAGSTDFWGVNFYNQCLCSWTSPLRPTIAAPGERACQLGWTPYPVGLYKDLLRVSGFGLPIYVTENGIGTEDDPWRCAFLLEHLRQVHAAIGEGADVRGFFHWSLLDNFEWADGYHSQFGLVEVDRATFARRPKPSFDLYGKIAAANAIEAEWFAAPPWRG